MQKHHYVYLITEKSTNKKYIGSRSSKVLPEEDLGTTYFSSSSVKSFVANQKQSPDDYEYEVLSTHDSRESAYKRELDLLLHHNAKNNDMFYNVYNTSGSKRHNSFNYIVSCRNKNS